ncbi:MAG: N-acetyltransferase family protein [Myxococcales bacterium]
MIIRPAVESDLPALMRLLLADRATLSDELPPDSDCYLHALREMQDSGVSCTYVAVADEAVVGTFMLTFLRHLMRRGSLVAIVEAVRVDSAHRGRGLGTEMMRWAIGESRRRGCSVLQLTSNLARKDAHRFYQRLGFRGTHLGMKLSLS